MAYKGGIWDSKLNDGRGGFRPDADVQKGKRHDQSGEARRWGQSNTERGARQEREAEWQKAGGAREDDLSRAIESERRGEVPVTAPAYPRPNHGTLGPAWGGTKIDRPIVPGGCQHNSQKVAITLANGKRLYPGQAHQIKHTEHLDLIIDCAGLLQGKKFVKASNNPRYRSLNVTAYPDVVTLAWPDMTAPTTVPLKFWERLIEVMPEDVGVCCMGGHGRTGTALAAMLVADGCEGQEAIDRVRAEHCVRAIETKEQEQYIRGLAESRKRRAGGGQ